MLFVLSPAKTLDYATPAHTEAQGVPAFLPQSTQLIELLRGYSAGEIAQLMSLSDKLAQLNVARYHDWSPRFTPHNSKPALLAFMGDVYEGLDAASLSTEEMTFAQGHLRILSGLYGILRPLDLMQPYRLEMGTRLSNPAGSNLYAFWGDTLTEALNAELAKQAEPVLVNLASDEYFKAIKPKKLQARLVECVFEDQKHGQYKIISFYAKRARGLMARYAMQQRVDSVAALREFAVDGYAYQPDLSSADRLVFRRPERH